MWSLHFCAVGHLSAADKLRSQTTAFSFWLGLEEAESHILLALIAEISILGHLLTRQHPHFIQLEGICLNVVLGEVKTGGRDETLIDSKGGAVPILMFEQLLTHIKASARALDEEHSTISTLMANLGSTHTSRPLE